jgi:hypothetical protein
MKWQFSLTGTWPLFGLSQSKWGSFSPSWEGVDKHQQILGIVSGTQTAPFMYCLTYVVELGDIKMLGQGGLKSYLSWVSSFMELFDKCGSQWLRYGNAATVDVYHPASRKFPSSVSNQACSCEVYHGSHSDKGHRNKAAASEAEVCFPVRAVHLAFLSAFLFAQTAIVSSSGALGSAWLLLS